ncbi:MAG: PEGA domain-containing protein [Ignavibacteriales bacterium]|nr:PEGA domain-containing protein [Ignavibacteriales bacterium]
MLKKLFFMIILFCFVPILTFSQDSLSTIKSNNILVIESMPPGAMVCIDDKECGITPLTLSSYDEGKYKISVTLDDKTKESYIDYGGGTKELFLILDDNYGVINITSIPANAKVFINGELYGRTPLKNSKVPLGKNNLKLVKENFIDLEKNLSIKNMKHDLFWNMDYKYRQLRFVETENISQIMMDGKEVTLDSFNVFQAEVGERNIEVRLKNFYKPLGEKIDIQTKTDYDIKIDYNYFTYRNVAMSAIVPGLGQFVDDSKLKGLLYFSALIGTSVLYFDFDKKYRDELSVYNEARKLYQKAGNEQEAVALAKKMEEKLSQVNKQIDKKNLMIGIALGIYLANIIDAVLFHSTDGNLEIIPKIENNDFNTGKVNVGLKLKF